MFVWGHKPCSHLTAFKQDTYMYVFAFNFDPRNMGNYGHLKVVQGPVFHQRWSEQNYEDQQRKQVEGKLEFSNFFHLPVTGMWDPRDWIKVRWSEKIKKKL